MTAQYTGVASFVERDQARHRAVVRAEGRETRGQGNASATITATLEPAPGGTHVRLVTDLKISGKVAQFGRGVLADVSGKLIGQFVQALEADVLTGTPTPASAPAPGPAPRAATEPVDLVGTAGSSVVKRVGPALALLAIVAWLLRRR
jgi:hypothetical protein